MAIRPWRREKRQSRGNSPVAAHIAGDPVPQYLRDHARNLRLNPMSVAQTTLRYRLQDGLTVLALLASRGRLGYPEFLDEIRLLVEHGEVIDGDAIDVRGLASLARASLGWLDDDGSRNASADLFQALRIVRRHQKLKSSDFARGRIERLDVQANLSCGRLDYVSEVEPHLTPSDPLHWMVTTELAHPERGRAGSTWDGWLRAFNEIFVSHGLTPITVAPGEGAPFDRVSTASGSLAAVRSGPLVTVVMSVYRPDQSLFTSLRSIIAQSWSQLEILVVDDCSPEEYYPLIEEAVALDDRITFHRMPDNGGTYKIRNFALARARGEFVTFQDADDWSHPERIERQLAPLVEDPDLVASLSMSLRVTAQMNPNKVGYRAIRVNASSLLFRREPVLEALGGYDEVRKAADTEFIIRLGLAFGEDRVVELDLPLALVQLTDDSLSRSDFLFGWHDANRVAYREAYDDWHGRIAAGASTARLDPAGPRQFAAPAAFLGEARSVDRQCDVLVVSDWRAGIDRYEGAVTEIETLVGAGLSTAVAHAETLRFASRLRRPPSARLLELCRDQLVERIRWEDPLRPGTVIVRDPELLSYPRPARLSGVRPERVIIHAGFLPHAPEGGWLVYEPSMVEARARALFGVDPLWHPATSDIADALVAAGARQSVLSANQLGVVSPGPPRGPWAERPVIGTAGLDSLSRDRLSPDELLRLLPQDPIVEVRVRDNDGALDTRTAPSPLPASWQRRDEEPLDEFLAALDVFVGWGRRTVSMECSHTVLRAMSLGCVVVAPPELASHLGDAAVYVGEQSVEEAVRRLADRPDEIIAQRQRGYDFIAAQFSASVFATRVRALTQVPEAGPRQSH